MITDNADEDFFSELHYLATLHPQAVCSGDDKVLKHLEKKHNVDIFTSDVKAFYDGLEVVYINAKENQAKYIEHAIKNKVHIITEVLDMDRQQAKNLYLEAKKNKVMLIENMKGVYSRNWNQLLWMLNTGMIGEPKNINISVDSKDQGALPLIIFLLTKILNGKIRNITKVGFSKYADIIFSTDTCIVHIQIADGAIVKDAFEIIGDKGKLKIASPWQEINYFSIMPHDQDEQIQRFSYNVPANRLRHCYAELINNLKQKQFVSTKFNDKDGALIDSYLKKIDKGSQGG
jgi:predicted dehydrogenase